MTQRCGAPLGDVSALAAIYCGIMTRLLITAMLLATAPFAQPGTGPRLE